jgi:hypothetical protein
VKQIVYECASVLSLVLGMSSAQADTIESVQNSTSNRTQEYVFDVGSLDAANTYVLKHAWAMWQSTDGEVVGQLEIAEGGQISNATGGNRTWVMSANTVLNGGTLVGSKDATKRMEVNGGGFDFSLQSGTLTANSNATLRILNADLSGDGGIEVTGAGTVQFQSTVDTTGFTGTFNVTGSTLDLDAISTASFGLSLSSAGVYANDADAAFTSLTIMGSAVANATYTRTELLAYGTSAFSQDWSSFITAGSTGTITVNSLVPEPRQYAFIFGLMIFIVRLLSRAKYANIQLRYSCAAS